MSGGSGELHCKGTGIRPWELRDGMGLLLASEIDDRQANGSITLWRNGLGDKAGEDLVVVGISQIEE